MRLHHLPSGAADPSYHLELAHCYLIFWAYHWFQQAQHHHLAYLTHLQDYPPCQLKLHFHLLLHFVLAAPRHLTILERRLHHLYWDQNLLNQECQASPNRGFQRQNYPLLLSHRQSPTRQYSIRLPSQALFLTELPRPAHQCPTRYPPKVTHPPALEVRYLLV